jgi:hypothetical protein
MIKKAFKQHDSQEHKGGKGTSLKLKKGGMKKYASGGAIPSETTSGSYKTTLMHQAKADNSPAKTGDVKKGNGGGYKMGGKTKKMATGGMIPSESKSGSYATTLVDTAKPDNAPADTVGVRYGNAGGFKSGGKFSKKAYATGGTVNSGRAVAMPQGAKKPSSPVSTNRVAGTFKKGGKVTPAEGNLMKAFGKENAPAMKSAKAQSNEVYSKYQKMATGGSSSDDGMDKSTADYDKAAKYGRELEDAMNPLSMAKEMYDKVRNSKIVKEAGDFADEYGDLYMKGLGLRSQNAPGPRVTKTKQSVTVSKKRGGSAC